MQKPKTKPIHMASTKAKGGGVISICFDLPVPINPQKGHWTYNPADVSCKKCVDIITGKFDQKRG